MRQVLAQPKPVEQTFTAMVANMGREKSSLAQRRIGTCHGTVNATSTPARRTLIISSGSDTDNSMVSSSPSAKGWI